MFRFLCLSQTLNVIFTYFLQLIVFNRFNISSVVLTSLNSDNGGEDRAIKKTTNGK